MNRLDNVDAEVKTYFAPVAKLVLASRDPLDAVTTALAALSGIKEVPLPRSLLTLADDMTTLQMMSKEGRINRAGHIT
jgi:ATP-dependent RNA helicase DDX21